MEPRLSRRSVRKPAARSRRSITLARIYCSEKFFAPMITVWRLSGAVPESGTKASARAATSAPRPSLICQRERRRRPASTRASSPSTASASIAAAAQPVSTRTQFSVCRPEKIRSPRLGWPTVVASVAAPIVQTAAVRMPARITGAPSGSSTIIRRWRRVMPIPSAASSTAGSIPCKAAMPFRRIGSRA